MANFRSAVLTKDGIALLAKAQAGAAQIEFTRAGTGNGEYGDNEALDECTSLKSQKQSFPINTISVINDATVYLKFVITNKQDSGNLQAGYYVKEVGIFANDPDKGEILYSIAVAVIDQWDYLPAYNELMPSTITMEFYTEVANAKEVYIQAGAGIYVLQEDFNQTVTQIYEDMKTGNTLAGDHLIHIGRELTEFTWQQLSEIAKAGTATENNIHVGDYKPLTLSYTEREVTTNYTLRMQVAGINTYAAYNVKSTWPAYHIDWISIELYSRITATWAKGTSDGNVISSMTYPYGRSNLAYYIDKISNDLPEHLKSLIVHKGMYTEVRFDGKEVSSTAVDVNYITELLWVPTEFEITGNIAYGSKRWSSIGQMQYPLFSNSGIYSRMKSTEERGAVAAAALPWWTMTVVDGNKVDAVCINEEGVVTAANVDQEYNIPICFRL